MENALKALSQTETELRVGNHIVVFGGRDLEGLATPRKNADGSAGEYFTPDTDLSSRYTKTGRLPLDWEHGRAPEGEDPGVLGFVDWSTAKTTDAGVWVERVLDRRNRYVQWLEPLIAEGLIGNSTEADPSAVEKAEDGHITRWPLVADTLTVTPMEPRMLTANALQAAKALGLLDAEEPTPEAEAEDAESVAEAVKAVDDEHLSPISEEDTTMAENEVVTMTREEIDALVKAAATEAVKAVTPVDSGGYLVEDTKSPGKVTHDEADNPFLSLAEQCKAVKAFALRDREDPRLKRLKATGAAEGQLSEGGFLLEPTLVAEVLRPLHEEGPFTRAVRRLPVGNNSNYGWINGVNETSRADGSRWGGIRGYRLAEGGTLTSSKPAFRRINWELKKYAVLVYATDELLSDVAMFSEIVRQGAGEELAFMANDDIYRGAGTSGPHGILESGALISVAKETGQAADTVVMENLINMWQQLHPRNRANAAWYINSEVEPQLDMLALTVGTAALEPRYVAYGPDGVLRIKGRPVIVNEFSSALGDVGDILLGDMREYLFWEKGGVQEAQSIHVQFITDETVFRFIYRCDGQTSMASPITPYKGSNTQSAFVTLAERA